MNELYLNAEELKTRKIGFAHCEDDECGFVVEFMHPNSTFFYCEEHRNAVNVDLNTIPQSGAVCELHGRMYRYDLMKDDNICPRCKRTSLAVLSMGSEL